MNYTELDKCENKGRIAIVVVGYNRLNSLRRLLNSILNASYTVNDIPLVISIDCSGDTELYNYVNQFQWPYGEKYVNIEKSRLGLKNHIFKCGDLVEFFQAIILLEDDLYVSPFFYDYSVATVNKYGEDERIAGISLYTNEINGYVGLPFSPTHNGSDVFLMQDVSTWGQCWTEQMWKSFKSWFYSSTNLDIQNADMPNRIKQWKKAWSKYYNAYVVSTERYFLYPYVALTTNFNDAGEHSEESNSVVQTNMLWGNRSFVLHEYEHLVKYDIFFNNVELYKWLPCINDVVELDIYGFRPDIKKRYLLSSKQLAYKIVSSFGCSLRPIELNIKFSIPGNDIFLYDTAVSTKKKIINKYTISTINYFLHGFDLFLLIQVVKHSIICAIKKRVRIK